MQRLAAVAVMVWDHTQKPAACDWKRHWPMREQILSKSQLDRTLIESQESAPAAQQEPASSSSGPAAPMPTQNLQNEQMDSPMDHKNAENAKERGQARRQQVKSLEDHR